MTQREQDRLDFPSILALLMDYDEAACSHMSSSIQVYTSFSVCSVNRQRPSTIKTKHSRNQYIMTIFVSLIALSIIKVKSDTKKGMLKMIKSHQGILS